MFNPSLSSVSQWWCFLGDTEVLKLFSDLCAKSGDGSCQLKAIEKRGQLTLSVRF
jgi:hypothetical protein